MAVMKKKVGRAGTARSYTVFYLPDVEVGGYTAHVPALGIVTEGETMREARLMAHDAVEGRVAVLRLLGQRLPKDIHPERVEVQS